MNLSNISKKDTGLLFLIILVLALLGSFFIFSPDASTPFGPVELSGGSITVEDQTELDRVVFDAELIEPGWITIHESLSDAPASIIGTSQYLEAGVYQDLVIPLDRGMIPSYKYITLLHVDDGDQQFDAALDSPVSVNGAVVRPDFVAQGDSDASDETIEE